MEPNTTASKQFDGVTVDLAIFKVGSISCALPSSDIQEIIKVQGITHVRQAPDWVSGVINLRGGIVTLISLHRKFKVAQPSQAARMRIFIVRAGDERIGLLADSVEDIITANVSDIDKPPSNLRGIRGHYFRGVLKMPGALVAILDLSEVLKIEED